MTITKKQHVDPLYADSIQLDEKTGLPLNYSSLFAAYKPLLLSVAERANIPEADREDAAQVLQWKFWAKNGLEMFDPNLDRKFATLYRAWASKFILQERDKVIKNQRFPSVDTTQLWSDESSLSTLPTVEDTTALDGAFVTQWIEQAQTLLEASGKAHLVPVLNLCVSLSDLNTGPTRAQITELTGVPEAKATAVLRELRETLTSLGMGMESLYA